MSNKNQNTSNDENSRENREKLYSKMKETWSGLSGYDVRLYDRNRDEFFKKLEEKQHISKEDGQKIMKHMESECGCDETKAA